MKHYFCCRSLGREEKVKRNVQSAFGVISALAPYLVESYSNRSWHGLLLYRDRFWALVEGNTITLASSMIGRRMGQARGSKEGIEGRVQGKVVFITKRKPYRTTVVQKGWGYVLHSASKRSNLEIFCHLQPLL